MKSGVYEISNLINGRSYIGSSVNMPSRWRGHRNSLKRGAHENKHLQNAWNKYGQSAFKWRVLLICKPEDRLFYEQRAIDAFDSARIGYNKCPTAGSAKGLVFPEAAKAKLSALKTGVPMSPAMKKAHAAAMANPEVRQKISQSRTGRKLSEAHRAAIAQSGLGKRRKPRSPEWKAKLSAAGKGKKMPADQRAKIAASMTGRKRPARSAAMIGTKLSDAHRAAIATGLRRRRERCLQVELA